VSISRSYPQRNSTSALRAFQTPKNRRGGWPQPRGKRPVRLLQRWGFSTAWFGYPSGSRRPRQLAVGIRDQQFFGCGRAFHQALIGPLRGRGFVQYRKVGCSSFRAQRVVMNGKNACHAVGHNAHPRGPPRPPREFRFKRGSLLPGLCIRQAGGTQVIGLYTIPSQNAFTAPLHQGLAAQCSGCDLDHAHAAACAIAIAMARLRGPYPWRAEQECSARWICHGGDAYLRGRQAD